MFERQQRHWECCKSVQRRQKKRTDWPCVLLLFLFMWPVASLCALFAKPMAGKAQAGRPDENSRSCRKFRRVSSLLAGAAAVAANTLYSLLSFVADTTDAAARQQRRHCFLGGDQRGRRWHPTPALLPGKSHERRSLVGCRLWGCTELDTTEVT